MNVQRMHKEARPLFWPWCAVAIAALVPLFCLPQGVEQVSRLAFILGIPILASLALGNEFQYRTLSLLLSQPVNRMEIWREKMSVTIAAVAPPMLIFYLSLWRTSSFRPGLDVAVLIGTVASATYWTLFARSTLGGATLNIAVQLFIIFGITYAVHREFALLAPVGYFFLFCYAGVMLWLGWRKLARFQAVGDMAGDDLLTAGPSVLPEALTGWLRCRPSGAALNLFRKEIRLLRPVWLITLLAAVGWGFLTLFGLLGQREPNVFFKDAVAIWGAINVLMVALLAGALPLGEEKTAGTHNWQLTFPAPASLQWRTKLWTALCAGLVGAGLLPILGLFGTTPDHMGLHQWAPWLLCVALLTFAAFWCACACNGTVSTVLWVAPVTLVLGSASYFARQWADKLVLSFWGPSPADNLRTSWLLVSGPVPRHQPLVNLLGSLRFDWWVAMVAFHHSFLMNPLGPPLFHAVLVGGPALILACVQSYRLYRVQPRDGAQLVLRNLLPLALLVFLCGFALTAFNAIWHRAEVQVPVFVTLTNQAIQETLTGPAKPQSAQPLQLTGDEVAKAWHWPVHDDVWRWAFENTTRHWLSGARITVTPDKAHPSGYFCSETRWGTPWCSYSATIQLADGTEITESYGPATDQRWKSAGLEHLSVYVRWPGAAKQEPLWGR